MLIAFRTRNYLSLRDDVELSMVVPNWVDMRGCATFPGPAPDLRVGSVAAIYGANASGKTTVIRALWQMSVMVTNSHQRWKSRAEVPHFPFFSNKYKEEPTFYEADVLLDGAHYQYGMTFNSERILQEWLYTFPKSRPRLVFERDATRENEYRFGRHTRGRLSVIAELTRPNSLFLSAAAANNHPDFIKLAEWFDDGIQRAMPQDRGERLASTYERLEDESTRKQLIDLVRFADLGIQDISVTEEPLDEQFRDQFIKIMAVVDSDFQPDETVLRRARQSLELSHETEAGEVAVLNVKHESDGTRTWLALLGHIVTSLDAGSVLLVDELDASLHPKLSSEIVRIFHDPQINTKGAQLVFNTHDPSLMGSLLGESPLRRDEVWLTEKDRFGVTHLYPLTDFRPRKSENIERGYLQGRYGGVPFIDRDFARAALGQGEVSSVDTETAEFSERPTETPRNAGSSAEVLDSV